jgi:carboxymethylenebutenolidase
MWNTLSTDRYLGMMAGVTMYAAGGGDLIRAYVARPEGPGPHPSILLVHHAPGWDEFNQEFARRFANHGYIAMVPNLYERAGHGTPDDVAAIVRAAGGVPDDQVVADNAAAMQWLKALPTSNGKVGIIGSCSGGRHALLTASRVSGFDAVADLWGGSVVARPDQLNAMRPVAPIDLTPNLNAPLLGLFGNDDQGPSPAQVDEHEEALQRHGKTYFFYRYDDAGHGFFNYDRPSYRVQQAMDGWGKLFDFFGQYLA